MWRALKHNLPVKLTSLALALLLWAMVAGQEEDTRELRVPVELPALPDSLMHLLPPPEDVAVTFRASGRRLFWFRLQPPRLVPTFSLEATEEPVEVALREEFLDLPRQFDGSVADIQPSYIRIHLAEVMEKSVSVRAVLGKEPRHPYRLDEERGLVVEPAQVTARGPKQRVSQMPWVRTEFLDLLDETQSGQKELGLEAEDPLIRFTPDKVKVSYQISEWESDG